MINTTYSPANGGLSPYYPVVANGLLYFAGNDSVHGYELFSTDGSTTKGIIPASATSDHPLSNTTLILAFNNSLAYGAFYDGTGQELWFYNYDAAGIFQTAADLGLSIYPNPFNENILLNGLKAGLPYDVIATDITGRIIIAQHIIAANNTFNFNLSNLAAGIYTLRVQHDGEWQTLKVIKQ